ncbi:hypothetical protein [Paratissierella segnis]|uniref:Uncharacterized protein n=1 Tax=Paratissierella segnis TaxID=2763679 RepID=A0A926ETS3_9FIRM|nr:hypothetical protein [Paratissierella segnis]MBC8588098.1 hypothetical protein [Paratissierella segnis]
MGLYGSPDLSKKYGDIEEYEKQKKKKSIKISIQAIVLVVMYLILIINNDNKIVMTASYVGVLSMVYFIINFIMMIYKLIKKQSVNKEVIKILICIALFIISGLLI